MSTVDFRGWVTPAVVALMLVLAGCATETTVVQADVETASHSPSPTEVAQPPILTSSGYPETPQRDSPDQNLNLSEYGQDLGAAGANISLESKQRVEELVSGFYDGVATNSTERREVFLESAEAICEQDREYRQELSLSTLKESGETTKDGIRRVHYGAQIVKNELNGDIPLKPFGEVRNTLTEASKYTPLVGSYNQLSQSACDAANNRTDTAIHDFQTAAVLFGVDSSLIATGAFYQPAFAGTRFITNRASQVGLYRLRYVCGDRCWALGMSEIHVSLRGSMHSVTSTLLRKSQEFNVSLSRADLEAVASSLDTEVGHLLQSVNEADIPETLQSVSDDVVSCGESMLEGSNEKEGDSGGDGLLGGDGIDTGDLVEGGEELIEGSQEAIERCSNQGK